MSAIHQWEAFQRGDEASDVASPILESWKRSRWSGVSIDTHEIPWKAVPDDLPLVRSAAPVLLAAAESLPDAHTALTLSDAQGHVVWRWVGQRDFERVLDAGALQLGGVFSEERIGTNGIGVALETGRPACVIGAEHYVAKHHTWACAAAPVRHPRTGRIVGAVNVSTRARDANQFFRLAAQSLASQVEQALLADLDARERQLHDAFRRRSAATATPLVALNDKTLIVDAAAATLDLDHARLWRLVRERESGARIRIAADLVAAVTLVDDDRRASGAVLELFAAPTAVATTDNRVDATRPAADATPDAVDASTTAARRSLSPLERAEFDVIRATLEQCAGNRSDAARALGISRSTLYQKLRRYHLG